MKMSKAVISESVMHKLRQRIGLEPNDTSKDRILQQYTPHEAFHEVLMWEGIQGYTDIIINWLRECGYNVEEIE
jgi:hypothetical protein